MSVGGGDLLFLLGGGAAPRRPLAGVDLMIALEAGALILGLAVIGLIFLLDNPENEGG